MNITSLTGGTIGTNCYIVENNKDVILIDFVPEVEEIIKKNGYKLRKILLTHIHFDHFEMLSLFQERYDFQLVLSPKAKERINKSKYNLLNYVADNLKIKDVDLNNAVTVKEDEEIEFENTKIKVLEAPGHSEDSLIYIIDDMKTIFAGDVLFNQSIGRTDFPDGNYKTLMNSINKLFKRVTDDYTVYPGHGNKTSIGFEKRYNPYLSYEDY